MDSHPNRGQQVQPYVSIIQDLLAIPKGKHKLKHALNMKSKLKTYEIFTRFPPLAYDQVLPNISQLLRSLNLLNYKIVTWL